MSVSHDFDNSIMNAVIGAIKVLTSRSIYLESPIARKLLREMSTSLFLGEEDIHNGITVSSIKDPCNNINEFTTKLKASLEEWQRSKRSAIWFKVDVSHALWIPVLAKHGFQIHNGVGDIVTMVRWLPKDEISRIPIYAHTLVGSGAVVINNENKLLVVKERYRDLPFWKLPGGYVEPQENIADAAMREVLEETNIRTEFEGLVMLRHSLNGAFGCSDLYFIVKLKPLSLTISKQKEEVEDARWMHVDEFLNHPEVHEFNRMCVRKSLLSCQNKVFISKDVMQHPVTRRAQTIYSINQLSENSNNK